MKPIEFTDFLDYRSVSGVNFSPEGDCAAFAVTQPDEVSNSYNKDLWIARGDELEQLTSGVPVTGYIWDTDDTLLFSVDTKKEDYHKCAGECTVFYRICVNSSEKAYAFTVPVGVRSIKKVCDGTYVVMAQCDANYPDYYKMSEDERIALAKEKENGADFEIIDEIPFWSNGAGFVDKKRTRLFVYTENGGVLTPVTDALFGTEAFSVSGKYIVYAGDEYDRVGYRLTYLYSYNIDSGETKCFDDGGKYEVEDIEPAGDKFIFAGTTGERYGLEENDSFYSIDPESGDIKLLADPDMYIGNCIGCDVRYGASKSLKYSDGYLYFTTTQEYKSELWRMDMDGAMESIITKDGSVEDFDIFGDKIIFSGLYDVRPQELYHAALSEPVPVKISDFNTAALEDRYIAVPEQIDFTCHGVDMHGWVLLPKDYDGSKSYPALLEVHGGPRTSYGPTFFHEMQSFASAGFFVFFCNPEGSSGTNEFTDLRGKYGTIDYEDIMYFTDTVLEKYPQIDKARVGMTGGSYGGFMANWIIGHTDRFAAVASQRSISNWISFYEVSDIGPWFGRDQTAATPYSEEGLKKMWDASPLKYAPNVKTPTLFIHSNEDYRCPVPEGIQMYTALVENGVPARMCYFKGENHELSRSGKPKNRIKRLSEIYTWIRDHTEK